MQSRFGEMQNLIFLVFLVSALANEEDKTLGMSEANPASSCNEIYKHNSTSRGTVGQYWIKTNKGKFRVTCNMKLKCGGIQGGWMQVVDIDMNRDDSCPGRWRKMISPRKLCYGYIAGCAFAHFYGKGYTYEHICGQAKAYQKGSPDAFVNYKESIDGLYVEGISITVGSPRKHVWTYAVGTSDDHEYSCCNCPCATHPGIPPPAYVKNNHYCESGNVGEFESDALHLLDPLWDGHNCTVNNGCCGQTGLPWFHRELPTRITEDFEIRICKDSDYNDEDIGVEKLNLFVL